MFLQGDDDRQSLTHNPFLALVSPRPIGWIGTKSAEGINNLAPFSFFTIVSDDPRIVMFCPSSPKDTLANVEKTGVFTASLVSASLAEAMNASSASVAAEVDEFELAGLTARQGQMVNAPFVGESPAALECRVTEIIHPKDLDGRPVRSAMVLGQVLGIHIDDRIIVDGKVDLNLVKPLARLGYRQYSSVESMFEMARPSVRKPE